MPLSGVAFSERFHCSNVFVGSVNLGGAVISSYVESHPAPNVHEEAKMYSTLIAGACMCTIDQLHTTQWMHAFKMTKALLRTTCGFKARDNVGDPSPSYYAFKLCSQKHKCNWCLFVIQLISQYYFLPPFLQKTTKSRIPQVPPPPPPPYMHVQCIRLVEIIARNFPLVNIMFPSSPSLC